MVSKMEYDPLNPIPLEENGGLEMYLEVENLSMGGRRYVKDTVREILRQRAVLVTSKYSRCENFDPVIPFLAMNYFDRYILRTDPLWGISINCQNSLEHLALCCLTLAWKMRDPNFILSEYLEAKPEINDVVTSDDILAMEHDILTGIDWHLRPVTALCFVPYFEQMLDSTYGFRRRTINQIIIQSQRGISVTHLRPSVIAASALLAASSFLYPTRFSGFVDRIIAEKLFTVEDIEECITSMVDLCNELKLMIESAIPEGELLPKKKVRAGTTSQKFIEIAEKNASQRLKQVAAEPSQESGAETSKGTSELSERGAAEPSQDAGAEKSKEGTSQLSEREAAEPSQDAGAEKSEEGTSELPEQVTSELHEEVAAETSDKSNLEAAQTSEKSEIETVETSEKSKLEVAQTSEKAEIETAETSEKSKDKAAESSQTTPEKSKQEATEAAETSEKSCAKIPEQVASEMSGEAAGKTDAKGKHDVEQGAIESFHKWGAEESFGTASNHGETSSQRPGKEKVKEVELTIFSKMKVEDYSMQFNFQLRWGTEEGISDDDFIIFSPFFDMVPPAPAVEDPEMEDEEVQPNGQLQQFCNFCCKCCCECCKLL